MDLSVYLLKPNSLLSELYLCDMHVPTSDGAELPSFCRGPQTEGGGGILQKDVQCCSNWAPWEQNAQPFQYTTWFFTSAKFNISAGTKPRIQLRSLRDALLETGFVCVLREKSTESQ